MTPSQVDAFMSALQHPLKAEIEAVRALIRGADERIRESGKWNAPSGSIPPGWPAFEIEQRATTSPQS